MNLARSLVRRSVVGDDFVQYRDDGAVLWLTSGSGYLHEIGVGARDNCAGGR